MTAGGFLRTAALAAAFTAIAAGAGTLASAAPAHNVCVPQAVGVPSRPGPPDWMGWTGGTGLVEPALDDPRWLGASGQTFGSGSAIAPLHTRMLWATTGTTKYLYLSFLVDLDGVTGAGVSTPRDVFVGFRRPTAFHVGTHDEWAYMFEFHLTGTGAGSPTSTIAPTYCESFNDCAESPGPGKDFWRLFVNASNDSNEDCQLDPTTTVHGPAYTALTVSGGAPPIDWMTNTTPAGQDAVRYWKLDASPTTPGAIQNRWAVQIRMKVAATDGEPIQNGIPPSSTFWYEVTGKLPGGQYSAISWWPRELSADPHASFCVSSSTPNTLVHPQLPGDASACAGSTGPGVGAPCSVDNFSAFTTFNFGAPRPATCDGGLFIDTPYIGAVVDPGGTDFTTVNPTTSFQGKNKINTVLAQVVNLGSTDVTAPILARFRLAHWGSAPWLTPSEHGLWPDMRGAENGVCGVGAAPSCGAMTIPHFVDTTPHDGLADTRAPIKFTWKIGDGAAMGNSEFCKFGLDVPGAASGTTGCTACDCKVGPNACDDSSATSTDVGTRSTISSPANPSPPCVTKRIEHECMFVELSSPSGSVQFAQQSSWNNMNFDNMSTVSREALIDARQLPKGPNQKEQDIYLIAMARNMPGAIPGGATDAAHFVRDRALQRAEVIAAPYLKDLQRIPQEKVAEIARQLGQGPNMAGAVTERRILARASDGVDKVFLERIQRLAPALQIMSDKDARLVVGLVQQVIGHQSAADLNVDMVSTVGPAEAAGIVPTLEIYPFYRPLGLGNAYLPMTSFTVFLAHEGTMTGIDWVIDGATRVGENIYRLQIPVGFARKIRVRAQAIQPPEAKLGPNNPVWPCAGGCASCGGANRNCGLVTQVGNTLPGLLAGVFVMGRRRRRKQPAPPRA